MSEEKLKPCPFCGGEAEIFVSDVTDRALVYCKGCDAQIQMKPNEEEAIEAWNKRVTKETTRTCLNCKRAEKFDDYFINCDGLIHVSMAQEMADGCLDYSPKE